MWIGEGDISTDLLSHQETKRTRSDRELHGKFNFQRHTPIQAFKHNTLIKV
jgi:aconitase B